ncbi:MAG: hypothetical protein IJ057_07575 [Bacteroidales bacterium]|nr:hypothetical protein [Bacteroidales bacterium]
MDKDFITFLAIGIIAIGMAIFRKFRPELIYRNYKGVIAPDRQRVMFFAFLNYGIMFILIGVATCVPQFQAVKSALAITIAVVATVVMLLMLWRILLSSNERLSRIGFALMMFLSLGLIGFSIYYWMITLN